MSLPTATFIGQQATVDGKTYQVEALNPPRWVGVTTGTHEARIRKLENSVPSILDYGANGDGVTNNTAAFEAAVAQGGYRIVPAGVYVTNPFTISNDHSVLLLQPGAKIVVNISGTTGIHVTGMQSGIEGGEVTVPENSGQSTFSGFLVDLDGFRSYTKHCEIHYDEKNTDWTSVTNDVPYNTGCIATRQPKCEVSNCNIYNAKGAGVYNYREDVTIRHNSIHDNILGINLSFGGSSGFGDNARVLGNVIEDNNAGNSGTWGFFGGDGILTNEDTKGHIISGNQISGSGEHGVYSHSSNTSITGNITFSNNGSGIKTRGEFVTVTGNSGLGNCLGTTDDNADYYFQNGRGNVCSSNTSENSNSYGIRVVYIDSQSVAGEERRFVITGNTVYNANNTDLIISGIEYFTITGNSFSGDVLLGTSNADDPFVEEVNFADNVVEGELQVGKVTQATVFNNRVHNLALISSGLNSIIDGNTIYNQGLPIGLLDRFAEFSRNRITYTQATTETSLFEQASSPLNGTGKVFEGNTFNSSGGRFIHMTSQGASGDSLTFIGNRFGGSNIAVYTWGERHMFMGNRALDNNQIAWFREDNCIVTGNFGSLAVVGGGNYEAGNIT